MKTAGRPVAADASVVAAVAVGFPSCSAQTAWLSAPQVEHAAAASDETTACSASPSAAAADTAAAATAPAAMQAAHFEPPLDWQQFWPLHVCSSMMT